MLGVGEARQGTVGRGPVLRQIPGARVQFGAEGGGGGQVSISLVGDDGKVLEDAAAAVEREMRGIPGLANVISTAALVRPEIPITPKGDVGALEGVSASDISSVVRVATLGDAHARPGLAAPGPGRRGRVGASGLRPRLTPMSFSLVPDP